MIPNIQHCYEHRTDETYCALSPNCKGWGCKFLTTEIPLVDEELYAIPIEEINKPKIFAKVYKEAKEKGVLECPAYRSLFIDEVLENLRETIHNLPQRKEMFY